MRGNSHVRFGERGGETRLPQGRKVRPAPTLRTGANFPLLEAEIGPHARLVGLDYTHAMLEQARQLVEKEGWQNVELVEADAGAFDLDEQFDAVLWTLAASVVPAWQLALQRAAAHLKPGGRLVIADARFTDRWYVRPFNWVADLLGVGAAADVARRPWELMPRFLDHIGYAELLMGFLYVAWGTKPPSQSIGRTTGRARTRATQADRELEILESTTADGSIV